MAPTVPGQGLGLYNCGYRTLAQIAALHAGARLALLDGQLKVAGFSTTRVTLAITKGGNDISKVNLYLHCTGHGSNTPLGADWGSGRNKLPSLLLCRGPGRTGTFCLP